MGSIIYFIGLVLAILAVIDIIKKPISLVGKVISCVLVLITSWVGLVVYYLGVRVVEGACLENRCTFARTGGSNPFLTATNCSPAL